MLLLSWGEVLERGEVVSHILVAKSLHDGVMGRFDCPRHWATGHNIIL